MAELTLQERKLNEIALAIQAAEGSSAPVPAPEFPARIRALSSSGGGGGSDFAVPLKVTADPGALITAVNGGSSVSAVVGSSGKVTLILTAPGVWEVTAKLNAKAQSKQIEVTPGYDAAFSLVSKLPDGYTELEYIQTSGSQYINSGIKPNAKIRITMDVETLAAATSTQKTFWGSNYAPSSGTKYYFICGWNTTGVRATATSDRSGSVTYYNLSKDTTLRRMVITLDGVNRKAYVEGEPEVTIVAPSVSTSMSAIKLLAGPTGTNGIAAKFYSCQIYTDGVLERDFRPCKNPSGTIGVYDLVNGAFYANAGSGSFTAGPAL